jgi:hypothetical protein
VIGRLGFAGAGNPAVFGVGYSPGTSAPGHGFAAPAATRAGAPRVFVFSRIVISPRRGVV